MGEYFANDIVQSCGKGYETEVTKNYPLFLTVCIHNIDSCPAIDLKYRKFPWVTHGTNLSHPSHGCLMGLI